MKRDKIKKCRYFNGVQNKICDAGMKYDGWNADMCFGELNSCDCYNPFTAEEIAEQDAEWDRVMAAIEKGVSGCCGAPLDKSQVISDGEHKGHGPRFCSKCRKLAYMV